MPTKKPPQFKRGLPKLTRRERQAVPSGSLVEPVVLPEPQLQDILRAGGAAVADPAPIYAALGEMVSLWRDMEDDGTTVRLTHQEEVTQAHVLAEYCREGAERLRHVAPNVWAAAEAAQWDERRRLLEPAAERAMLALEELAAAFEGAAARVEAQPSRSGPTANPARAMALRVVIDTLTTHSNPPMTAARARAVAAELLSACGVPMPSAPNELRNLEDSR
ncbi:hypothetical protein LK996_01175 [Lysobacter sp. A6]|uniref:Uncharacterized protein n=1 Tax=Noviluteimonas lactosilytica TaxID=2888523 RepID=A0ABS8JDK7_9GAMM|nr:hypothetical protein [Lysobacter lactosilyticus]MCC8361696.1 hypothetical protein [Lysobacter lactosilyticus]